MQIKNEKCNHFVALFTIFVNFSTLQSLGAFTTEVNKHSKSEGHQEQGKKGVSEK